MGTKKRISIIAEGEPLNGIEFVTRCIESAALPDIQWLWYRAQTVFSEYWLDLVQPTYNHFLWTGVSTPFMGTHFRPPGT